jgi:hypothetical protein
VEGRIDGDGFDGCWCSMMVCRCVGGGGGSGMVILGVWYVVCWCLLAMVLTVVFDVINHSLSGGMDVWQDILPALMVTVLVTV